MARAGAAFWTCEVSATNGGAEGEFTLLPKDMDLWDAHLQTLLMQKNETYLLSKSLLLRVFCHSEPHLVLTAIGVCPNAGNIICDDKTLLTFPLKMGQVLEESTCRFSETQCSCGEV